MTASGLSGRDRGLRLRRLEQVAAVVTGLVCLSMLTAMLTSQPTPRTTTTVAAGPSQVVQVPARTGVGLAGQLAEQARQATDPLVRLRLLLAAHTADPTNPAHRMALAAAVLADVQPTRRLQAPLDVSGTIGYATVSADASFLVTSSTGGGGYLWQLGNPADPTHVRPVGGLGGPVTAAAGVGTTDRADFVVASPDGVWWWQLAALIAPHRIRRLAGHADAVAVSTNDAYAVTIDATTATLWSLLGPLPTAKATLTYQQPVTTMAFAHGGLMLAAGHGDGTVTVYSISFDRFDRASISHTRLTTSGGGPVDAVAVSADASTVVGVHRDGTITVWGLRGGTPQPLGSADGAGVGRHRVWVSPQGDYAYLTSSTGAPTLWSLTDRTQPTRIHTLTAVADPVVPAMVSNDGATMVNIDRSNRVAVWDLRPGAAILADPVGRACQLALLDEQQWRQTVPETVAYPCPPTPQPSTSG